MKRTTTPKNKWYLVCDGKSASVTNNIGEAKGMNVVILEISANDAANMLALTLANK